VIRTFDGESPRVSPTAYVHDRAEVIGRVSLADHASVWPGAVLRGDIEPIVLGARSNVQDNAVLHTEKGLPTVLGDDVSVGHSAVLHGCTIEDGCLIGMGAIVLNGAVVERDCLVGAGAVVSPGTRIPSGHLAVGVPARVARALTDDERAHLRRNAANYLAYTEKHRTTSRPIG
jgi:carbonic anhydrase/acetyltransferase-like protein (isoleucine patch superfamily)